MVLLVGKKGVSVGKSECIYKFRFLMPYYALLSLSRS